MKSVQPKIFIIGLPRTGTTSICSCLLHLGYSVAHTAYTQSCFDRAQVIADTPVFNDYALLDSYYPNSKFIYLTRDISLWTPSIKILLMRMFHNVVRPDGGFNPYIKRCYQQTFSPMTLDNIQNTAFLQQCYRQHQQTITRYFNHRPSDFLSLDISANDSLKRLLSFLNIQTDQYSIKGFEHLNSSGKITAWNDIRHPSKISSTHKGKITVLDYLMPS
jgi:hypothetical protein